MMIVVGLPFERDREEERRMVAGETSMTVIVVLSVSGT